MLQTGFAHPGPAEDDLRDRIRDVLASRLGDCNVDLDDVSTDATQAVLTLVCPSSEDSGEVPHERWGDVYAALNASGEAMTRERAVVGVGISYRRRAGVWTSEPCVTVHVNRKRSPDDLRRAGVQKLPASLPVPGGGAVGVDVIEAGRIRRRIACGARTGWRGLGAGDGWGTLGLVARNRADGKPVAITAMHVTGLKAYPPGAQVTFKAVDLPGATPVHLGRLLKGTMQGIDAAKISIDPPAQVTAFLPGVGPLRKPRALTPADLHRPVQLYGARSRYQSGFITDLNVTYPQDDLEGVFLVRMKCGSGDSGAVCCDLNGSVLGLYVGSRTNDASLQVFCPITTVLRALDCEL